MGILPHWFKRKLGIAYGLTATGSSLGGVTFPIAVRNLIDEVGYVKHACGALLCLAYRGCIRFKWTMRIMGFILLFLLGICNAVGTPRFSSKITVF